MNVEASAWFAKMVALQCREPQERRSLKDLTGVMSLYRAARSRNLAMSHRGGGGSAGGKTQVSSGSQAAAINLDT